MIRISVTLTTEEAEALLWRSWHLGPQPRPTVLLHARAKLIDKLAAIPGYVPPSLRGVES
jgi:hypothetical protein